MLMAPFFTAASHGRHGIGFKRFGFVFLAVGLGFLVVLVGEVTDRGVHHEQRFFKRLP